MQDDTRDKIRDAAEQLFSDQGFANTSLRAITAHAGVNLAAVNYHFGSKEALIQDIFSHRIEALNAQRIKALESLEQAGDEISVEGLLNAYLGPTLSDVNADSSEARFMRLLGRTQLGASNSLRQFVNTLYAEVMDRFAVALSRALPAIPHDELCWRLNFVSGTLAYSLATGDRPHFFSDQPLPDAHNSKVLQSRLVNFLTAGLRAPLA